ncbi:MAG TPA: CHAT domain-containing tetratricopeptide repeat protein [Vicinamibacteria bacterium]|nr:CHAT domain-containing tetratricopeptide repeat protein [Vicinamibacteria bacterium]
MGLGTHHLGAAVAFLVLTILATSGDSEPIRSRSALLDAAAAHQAHADRDLSVDNRRRAAHHLHRALSLYRDLGRRDLEARVLVELGHLHRVEGRTGLALSFFDRAVSVDVRPGARALVERGKALSELGEHERALSDFHRASRSGLSGGERAAVLYGTAISLDELGRLSEARRAIELSLQASKDVDERFAFYADLLMRMGEIAKAFEVSEQARTGRSVSLRAFQEELLDDDTRLLSYFLGDERSFLWSVTRGTLSAHELPARRSIERLVREARRDLSTPLSRRVIALEKVSRLLLGPVAGLTMKPRLVVVSDGELSALPFAPLPLGSDRIPLVNVLEIVRLPAATLLPELRSRVQRTRFSRTVAVAADPSHGLPAARREAASIEAIAPSGQVEVVYGKQASRDWIARVELGSFRVLHFATHGALGRGIALRDGFLRLDELLERRVAAELVVLSSCDAGLARGFLEAGARRVIASYWAVDDEATAALMKVFYEKLFSGASPATALREAQMMLRRTPRFRSPYYWAGFELRGDWAF